MTVVRFQVAVISAAFALCIATGNPALAQKTYDSGAEVINLGNAPDDEPRLSAMIDTARGADLLVTIGGASVEGAA